MLERYGRKGVLFIGRGVAYRKTGLHGILFISTIVLLQPPPVTVHPRAPVHPASIAPPPATYNQHSPQGPVQPPLHGLLFIQPSTGYCSTSPPRGPVHPPLHGVLFVHRLDRSGHCSPSGNGLYYHGVLFIQPPTGNCSSKPPQQRSLFIQRQHQSASVSSSSEGITRV